MVTALGRLLNSHDEFGITMLVDGFLSVIYGHLLLHHLIAFQSISEETPSVVALRERRNWSDEY